MAEETEISNLFDGVDKSEQLNSLITALTECGKDYAKSNNSTPRENSLYHWLEKESKNHIVIKVVDKLNELGFEIVKKR